MSGGMSSSERTNVVRKILQVLHQTSGSAEDPRRLEALASEFERRTYESARSRQEYLQKIALKLAKLKQKAEEEMRAAVRTSAVPEPYVDAGQISMQHARGYSGGVATSDPMQQTFTVLSKADTLFHQTSMHGAPAGQEGQSMQQGYGTQQQRQTNQQNHFYPVSQEQEMDDFAYMAKMFLDTDAGDCTTVPTGEREPYSGYGGQVSVSYPPEPWLPPSSSEPFGIMADMSGPGYNGQGSTGRMPTGQQQGYSPMAGGHSGQSGGEMQFHNQYSRQNPNSISHAGMMLKQTSRPELRVESMSGVLGATSEGNNHSMYDGSMPPQASYLKNSITLKQNIQLVWQKLQSAKNDADKYKLQQILQALLNQKARLEGKQPIPRQHSGGHSTGMQISGSQSGAPQPIVAQFTGVPTSDNGNWQMNPSDLQRRYWLMIQHLRSKYLIDLQDLRMKMAEKCAADKLDPKTMERAHKFIHCADAIIPLLNSTSDDPMYATKGRTQQEIDQLDAIMKWLSTYQPLQAWQNQRAKMRQQQWQSQPQVQSVPHNSLPASSLPLTPSGLSNPKVATESKQKPSQASKPAAKRARKADSSAQQASSASEKASTEKPKRKANTASAKTKSMVAPSKEVKLPTVKEVQAPPAEDQGSPKKGSYNVSPKSKLLGQQEELVTEKDFLSQIDDIDKLAAEYETKAQQLSDMEGEGVSSSIKSAFAENARLVAEPYPENGNKQATRFVAANGLDSVSMLMFPPDNESLIVKEQFLDSMESTKLNVVEIDDKQASFAADCTEATGDSVQTSADPGKVASKHAEEHLHENGNTPSSDVNSKVYEGEHIKIYRGQDGGLIPVFETGDEPFQGYTFAKDAFSLEVAGRKDMDIGDMLTIWKRAISSQKCSATS